MILLTMLTAPWGYTEESGPIRWGEISKAYIACQTGINQSLIDIQTATTSKLGSPALNMQYVDDPTRFRSINYMLQATMNSYTSNSTEIDETLYYLEQFDFHALNEHTLNGKTYPLELQLVHKNQSGDTAIVVVTFDIGEPSQAIQNLWESFSAMENSSVAIFSPVDTHQLLPDDKTCWRYRGSLAALPCIEGVTWTILKTPVFLSTEQMNKFYYIAGPTDNCPLQPLGEHRIMDSYSGDTETLY